MEDPVRLSRRERYRLRRILRRFTTATMQSRCGLPQQLYLRNFFVPDEEKLREYRRLGGPPVPRVHRLDRAPTLRIDEADDGPVVRVKGLVWCERFTCPVCGPLMWTDAARELQRGVTSWQAGGGEVVDVLLRLAPLKARDLDVSLRALMDGWDAVLGRRQKQQEHRVKFLGLAGYHQQFAIGIDTEGRWDPCLRALLFTRGQALDDPQVLRRVRNAVWQGWVTGNHDIDLRPATRKRGISLTQIGHGTDMVAHAVSRYVAGSGSLPQGTRTMFEILTAACAGDRRDGDHWIEIERTLRRRAMRRWSRGMKPRLGLAGGDGWSRLEHRDIASFQPAVWRQVEPLMPAPLEIVEDALAGGQDPGVALTNWAREHDLPVPTLHASEPASRASKKRKKRRKK